MVAGASSTTAEDLRLLNADWRLPVRLSSRPEPVTSASLVMPVFGSMMIGFLRRSSHAIECCESCLSRFVLSEILEAGRGMKSL